MQYYPFDGLPVAPFGVRPAVSSYVPAFYVVCSECDGRIVWWVPPSDMRGRQFGACSDCGSCFVWVDYWVRFKRRPPVHIEAFGLLVGVGVNRSWLQVELVTNTAGVSWGSRGKLHG